MAAQLAIKFAGRTCGRRWRKESAGPGAAPGAQRIDGAVAQMTPERGVECLEAAATVGALERHHCRKQIRVAADRALAELNEAAGDDVGALYRDGDRHAAIKAAQIIERAFDDGLAAVHFHSIRDGAPQALGAL